MHTPDTDTVGTCGQTRGSVTAMSLLMEMKHKWKRRVTKCHITGTVKGTKSGSKVPAASTDLTMLKGITVTPTRKSMRGQREATCKEGKERQLLEMKDGSHHQEVSKHG